MKLRTHWRSRWSRGRSICGRTNIPDHGLRNHAAAVDCRACLAQEERILAAQLVRVRAQLGTLRALDLRSGLGQAAKLRRAGWSSNEIADVLGPEE